MAVSGKNLNRLRILGFIITTMVGLTGTYITLAYLNYGTWVYYMGSIMVAFVTVFLMGFILFILEWDNIVMGLKKNGTR